MSVKTLGTMVAEIKLKGLEREKPFHKYQNVMNEVQKKILVNKVVSSVLAVQIAKTFFVYEDLCDKDRVLIHTKLQEVFGRPENKFVSNPRALHRILKEIHEDLLHNDQFLGTNQNSGSDTDSKEEDPPKNLRLDIQRKLAYSELLTKGLFNLYQLIYFDEGHGCKNETIELFRLLLRIVGTMELLQDIANKIRKTLKLIDTRENIVDLPNCWTGEQENFSGFVNGTFKSFFGTRVDPNGGMLQGPDSGVKLYIPEGLDGFVMGYIHTDPKPFLHAIPDDECLAAPIAEYLFLPNQVKSKDRRDTWFKIQVPHCVDKKYLETIRVRHGDIHNNTPFMEVPSADCYFEVDETVVTIFTKHFSQFICTSCNLVCNGQAKAFIFGSLSPLQHRPRTASVRLYTCSPLYQIQDYKMQLLKIEKQYRRVLLEETDIRWNTQTANAKFFNITATSEWKPRPPLKFNQTYNSSTQALICRKERDEMADLLFCHGCKMDPTILAHFDFMLPENLMDATPFSAVVEMSLEPKHIFVSRQNLRIMSAQIDMYSNSSDTLELNRDQLKIRALTKEAVCTETELFDFGLNLGFTLDLIRQKRTNHPYSIENAALDMTCEWWDSEKSEEEIIKEIENAVKSTGKEQLVPKVRHLFHRQVPEEPRVISNKDGNTGMKRNLVENENRKLSQDNIFRMLSLILSIGLLTICLSLCT